MQPLGANWDLVADASCQEEEDEERQFGWLSRATVKWHQSRIIRSRAPPSAAVATGKRGCQGWLGGGIGLSWWVKRLVWVAGQVRGGVQELAALRDALPSQWEGTELVCVWVNKGLDARVEEKYWDGGGSGCEHPASEYGGLVLGADRASAGVPLVQEPGAAAQGVHVSVHLQGFNLPGGREGGRRDERRAWDGGSGGHCATLTIPQLTHMYVDSSYTPVIIS